MNSGSSNNVNEQQIFWGGDWTDVKNDIVVAYAEAYLNVMKYRTYWKLLYFDGFAGEGKVGNENQTDVSVRFSAAMRILALDNPRAFDMYYLVELNSKNAANLSIRIHEKFGKSKNAFVVQDDCNNKLRSLSDFLKSDAGKNYKVLAFIDPYGMELKWESIELLKNNPIDLWILVPTGLGINRLLKKDGNISDKWLNKLKTFLGMEEHVIRNYFYKSINTPTLFGDQLDTVKENNAIEKAGDLYKSRLNEVFKYVSNPFLLKNSTGTIMYHLFMASNNKTGLKISNEIILPRLR